MKFICTPCDYSTDRKFCLERHFLSSKHLEKVNNETTTSQKLADNEPIASRQLAGNELTNNQKQIEDAINVILTKFKDVNTSNSTINISDTKKEYKCDQCMDILF